MTVDDASSPAGSPPAGHAHPAAAAAVGEGHARLRVDPAFQAGRLLRIGFTVAPILFGADKFAHVPYPAGAAPSAVLLRPRA